MPQQHRNGASEAEQDSSGGSALREARLVELVSGGLGMLGRAFGFRFVFAEIDDGSMGSLEGEKGGQGEEGGENEGEEGWGHFLERGIEEENEEKEGGVMKMFEVEDERFTRVGRKGTGCT